MGIGGHMLGEKKLRRLNRLADMDFDRAYIRNKRAEGRQVIDGRCRHYLVDLDTGLTAEVTHPTHWTSCPKDT